MFLDSSVRSIRTISLRLPAADASAVTCACTSAAAARSRSSGASTPSGCTPTVVVWPLCRTVPSARFTSVPSTVWQQSRNASAHRLAWNPA